jgi:hypothetical protein
MPEMFCETVMKKTCNRSGPRHFVLITSDAHKTLLSSPSAYHLALQRLRSATWGFNERTRNRIAIGKGDNVIVYASGQRENGMTFVGKAKVAMPPRSQISKEKRAELGSVYQSGNTYDYYAQLERIDIFTVPVPIRPLIRQLRFIKQPSAK